MLNLALCKGSTRWAILVGKYAIKIPSLSNYEDFLKGLLSNAAESQWSKTMNWTKKFCPVLFTLPGYFMVIMPRVQVLSENEFMRYEHTIERFIMIGDKDPWPAPCE